MLAIFYIIFNFMQGVGSALPKGRVCPALAAGIWAFDKFPVIEYNLPCLEN